MTAGEPRDGGDRTEEDRTEPQVDVDDGVPGGAPEDATGTDSGVKSGTGHGEENHHVDTDRDDGVDRDTTETRDKQDEREADSQPHRESRSDPQRSGADGDLSVAQVDRVFSILTRAVKSDVIDEHQFERLLGVLERALGGGSQADSETLAELFAVLEDLVVDTAEVDVDGALTVLEEAVAASTQIDGANLEAVFDVLRTVLADPAHLEPRDVERFREGLEDAIADATDSVAADLDRLLPAAGPAGVDPGEVGDTGVPETFRIARIATGMTQRAAGYSLETGLRTGTRTAYAAANAESPAELLSETHAIALEELQRAGVDVGDERVDWLESQGEKAETGGRRPLTREALRERGERLLSRSAEIGRDETLHPAYPVVLDELAGDEARILRLLATEGPMATIDVRDRGFLPFRSRLVAANLTMVGSDAGCRHPGRTPVYLQNLERLGLVTLSDDPVDDLKRYQVLEAQSHVEAAREAARRPTTAYGSVHLSDLGVDFCRACMPFEVNVEGPACRFRREAENDRGTREGDQ